MKDLGTRQIIVPLNMADMRRELSLFLFWYNEHRPHLSLNGRTPQDVWNHSPPKPSIKTLYNKDLPAMTLDVSYFEGRKHLPIVDIKQAA